MPILTDPDLFGRMRPTFSIYSLFVFLGCPKLSNPFFALVCMIQISPEGGKVGESMEEVGREGREGRAKRAERARKRGGRGRGRRGWEMW